MRPTTPFIPTLLVILLFACDSPRSTAPAAQTPGADDPSFMSIAPEEFVAEVNPEILSQEIASPAPLPVSGEPSFMSIHPTEFVAVPNPELLQQPPPASPEAP